MQVNVEDLSTVKKVLHIEIPEEKVTEELEEAYKKLRKTAKVKGFRPGKVPRSVLERLYKRNVDAEVSAKLIQESLEEAIKETQLNYIGSPTVLPAELEEKAPYKYDATIELPPKIGHLDFKGLPLKKQLYQVTEEDVDGHIEMLRKSLGQLKQVEDDRSVKEDDVVLIDLEGFKDGSPFSETPKTENLTMKIGASQILKDLDDEVIGMRQGDAKEIHVRFPESYPHDALANVDITFQVSLKGIREEAPIEINDAFANIFGKETLADLREEIRNNLKQGCERRTEQELFEQTYLALLEKNDFEVPDILVAHELEGIVTDTERSLAERETTIEDQFGVKREEFAERYRDIAEKQVKRHLLLNRLAEQETLSLTDKQVDEEMKDMAQALNKTFGEIKNHYKQNKDAFEFFKHTLLEKQATQLIIENSNIEEIQPE